MSASVCSIDYIGTLYSCVNGFRPLVAAHLFPVHFQAVTLACTLASRSILTRPHSVTSKWPPAGGEGVRVNSQHNWVCLSDIRVRGKWQKSRAQHALQYGTEAASSWPAWPLAAARPADMCVCGIVASIRLHDVLYAPGHWLACPAHTSCVYTSCLGVNLSRAPLIRNFKDYLHFIIFIWAHWAHVIIIYLFLLLLFVIIYIIFIVKLVTKMERLINEGMPDGRRQSIVGQSSDFEVYPGAVWEPVP